MFAGKGEQTEEDWMRLASHPSVTTTNALTAGGPVLNAFVRQGRMTLEEVAEHPELPHNWDRLTWRDDLTTAFVVSHADFPWDVQGMTRNDRLDPMALMAIFPEKPWDVMYIFTYRRRDFNLIVNHADLEWKWQVLSTWEHKDINALLVALPDKPWNFPRLGHNKYLRSETVLALRSKPWVFDETWESDVSTELAILAETRGGFLWHLVREPDFKLVLQHSASIRQEAYELLSEANTLDMAVVAQLADRPWDWKGVSENERLTIEMVAAHPELPWDWGVLVQNPSIHFEEIVQHRELPWRFEKM